MALNRNVEIEIDARTWTSSAVPTPLAALHKTVQPISMLGVLLSTAIWTRPPTVYGFSLSDCWAWMRYLPALAPRRELKLRDEWTALDPHHKTVLSGDLGVGFATYMLARTLGFVDYADTLRVVNVLNPRRFRIGRTARRGPDKSPDYIATDAAGRFSVLECKGGQSTRSALWAAMRKGVAQKKKVETVGRTRLVHSLVAGVYVPQWGSRKPALFAVQDPEWPELAAEFAEAEPEVASRAVQQVSAAKQLAVLEMASTANTLVNAERAEATLERAIEADLRGDRLRRPERAPDGVRLVREYLWPNPTDLGEGLRAVGLRFTAVLPESSVELLRTAGRPEAAAEEIRSRRFNRAGPSLWEEETVVSTEGSIGAQYHLELLEG